MQCTTACDADADAHDDDDGDHESIETDRYNGRAGSAAHYCASGRNRRRWLLLFAELNAGLAARGRAYLALSRA